ncbi:small acid-soluble spore protein P [Xylanibacillus composti]|nr:small acid-soluble spore protein P [Xylanibacillus composti]MDT9726536.1 small acid-soluble spore protein P [Xylanibacillus composti]
MTNRQEQPRTAGKEPLDGSKKVKNRNHSRRNQHTEG